jgi:hypothetical protein
LCLRWASLEAWISATYVMRDVVNAGLRADKTVC